MHAYKTTEQFILWVNRPELAERAKELGYDNVFLWIAGEDHKAILTRIKETGKGISVFVYCMGNDTTLLSIWDELEELKKSGIRFCVQNMADAPDYDQYPEEMTIEEAVDHFPLIEEMKKYLIERGVIKDDDHKGRCGNCHQPLGRRDKYCQYCGSKRGTGSFEPFWNIPMVAYGPSYLKTSECRKCGYIWTDNLLGTPDVHYCPVCGSDRVQVIKETSVPYF